MTAAEQRSSSSCVMVSPDTRQVTVLLPPVGIRLQQQPRSSFGASGAASGGSSRVYRFDAVFPVSEKQETLFREHVQPLVEQVRAPSGDCRFPRAFFQGCCAVRSSGITQVLEGFNCTVFAYGQTGTGKTYTMEGPSELYDNVLQRQPLVAGGGLSAVDGVCEPSARVQNSSMQVQTTRHPRCPSGLDGGCTRGAGEEGGEGSLCTPRPQECSTASQSKMSGCHPPASADSAKTLLAADAGLLPRAVTYLCTRLHEMQADFCMRCSFLEIYNEELFDLLAPAAPPSQASASQQPKLRIYEDQGADAASSSCSWGRGKGRGAVRVDNLTEREVRTPQVRRRAQPFAGSLCLYIDSLSINRWLCLSIRLSGCLSLGLLHGLRMQDVFAVLTNAAPRRRFADSGRNARSSRSHTIFSLSVTVKGCCARAPQRPPPPDSKNECLAGDEDSNIVADEEEVLKIGKLSLVDLAG